MEHGLAAAFPAFLTHWSGIDKTLMTLIQAGMAHRLSASAWADILRELNVHRHDLHELDYLHAIFREKKKSALLNIQSNIYAPFSKFDDKDGYAGFCPSRWYINSVYMDYMEHIHPILDQCMSALTGYIIKWDHSFKLPKLLTKLDGVPAFVGLSQLSMSLSRFDSRPLCQQSHPHTFVQHWKSFQMHLQLMVILNQFLVSLTMSEVMQQPSFNVSHLLERMYHLWIWMNIQSFQGWSFPLML